MADPETAVKYPLDVIFDWYKTLPKSARESISIEHMHTLSKTLSQSGLLAEPSGPTEEIISRQENYFPTNDRNKIAQAFGLLYSVIQSGEKWSSYCDAARKDASESLARMYVHAFPEAKPEPGGEATVDPIAVNDPPACKHGKKFLQYCPECEASARWNQHSSQEPEADPIVEIATLIVCQEGDAFEKAHVVWQYLNAFLTQRDKDRDERVRAEERERFKPLLAAIEDYADEYRQGGGVLWHENGDVICSVCNHRWGREEPASYPTHADDCPVKIAAEIRKGPQT